MQESTFFIKYKNPLIGLLAIVGIIFIIFQVILPQIEEVKVKTAEVEAEEKKVEAMKETLSVLASTNDADLDRYFELTQKTLPQTKDILAVYNELASAAQNNEVALGELKIRLGSVYNVDKKKFEEEAFLTPVYGSSVMNFEVNALGETDKLRAFAQTLYRSVPLVEINEVTVDEEEGVLVANFFFNPFTVTTANTDVAAKRFSGEQLQLIETLQEWVENSKIEGETNSTQPTTSPTPTITPTVTPNR